MSTRSNRPLDAGSAREATASRASWIGTLELAGRTVPVKAYPAVSTTSASLLRQLHAGCGERIQQPRWCAVHGIVPEAEITRAYEYAPGDCIKLSETELDSLRLAEDKTLRVERFFDPASFDLALLSGRSLHLAPAHPAAIAEYAVVLGALRETKLWGFAPMVLSNHRHPVVLRPALAGLVLHVLLWPTQRRSNPFTPSAHPASSAQDVTRIVAAVRQNVAPIDWEALIDDSITRLAALVERKVAARNRPAETATAPARASETTPRKRRSSSRPGATSDRRRRAA